MKMSTLYPNFLLRFQLKRYFQKWMTLTICLESNPSLGNIILSVPVNVYEIVGKYQSI